MNKLLKNSFKKSINIFKKDNLYIYSFILPFNKYLYLSSFYSFIYILINDKDIYIENILKIIKNNDIQKIINIYNNNYPIEFYSFFYIISIFNIDKKKIENILKIINIYINKEIYYEIKELDDYLNEISEFINYILNVILFNNQKIQYELNSIIKLIYLNKIIINIKKDFQNNKIYIPENLKNNIIINFNNNKYNNNFHSINKKILKDFNLYDYLNYIIYRKGNIFRLSNDEIFENIILNLIRYNFENIYNSKLYSQNTNLLDYNLLDYNLLDYNIIYDIILKQNINIILKIINFPLDILEGNIKVNIIEKIKYKFNLGIINLIKIYFNYYIYNYFYYIKLF